MFISGSVFGKRELKVSEMEFLYCDDSGNFVSGFSAAKKVLYGVKINEITIYRDGNYSDFGRNVRLVNSLSDLLSDREEDWADSYFQPSRWNYLFFGCSPGENRIVTYDVWGLSYMGHPTRMILDWTSGEEHKGKGWRITVEKFDKGSQEEKVKEGGVVEDRFGVHRKIEPVLRWGHVPMKDVLDMLYRGYRYVRDDHSVYLDTFVMGKYVQVALVSFLFTTGEIMNMRTEEEVNQELGRKLRLEGIPVKRVFTSAERNHEGAFFLDPCSMLFVSSWAGETVNVKKPDGGVLMFAHLLLEPNLGCYYHQVVSASFFQELENYFVKRVSSLRGVLNL